MLRTTLALTLCLPSAAIAQSTPGLLPANSEVPLLLDREVSSQRVKAGDVFDVTVARDVWAGRQLAIPRGTHGRGVVAWKTGKGAFGKSGKMEIELRSIEVEGHLVPLTGKYRQEGKGNTLATVGTIVAAGVIAGALVTGHSAVFAQGTELRGYTVAPVAAIGSSAVVPQRYAANVTAPVVLAATTVAPTMVFAPAIPQRVAYTAAISSRAPLPVAYAIEDKADQMARLLRAQQGVHGRDAGQGWTITD